MQPSERRQRRRRQSSQQRRERSTNEVAVKEDEGEEMSPDSREERKIGLLKVPDPQVESALTRKSLSNSRVDWGGSSDFKGGRPVTFEVS